MEVIHIVSRQIVQQAKELDLLTYLKLNEPHELVHIAGQEFSTKTHDSLKISNGKWHWFSRGIGGSTALDYLIHVRGMAFLDAVLLLTGQRYQQAVRTRRESAQQTRHQTKFNQSASSNFQLPAAHEDCKRVVTYLKDRGICQLVIDYCVHQNCLYEDARYHNAVFVGFDRKVKPRHAMMRGTLPGSTFRWDAPKSNKRFTFALPASAESKRLYVFEGAVDLLSHATICASSEKDWQLDHRLCLGGLAALALEQYLTDYPMIQTIVLCLDQDEPGRAATQQLTSQMTTAGYLVADQPPPLGKDYNDYLCRYWLTSIKTNRPSEEKTARLKAQPER